MCFRWRRLPLGQWRELAGPWFAEKVHLSSRFLRLPSMATCLGHCRGAHQRTSLRDDCSALFPAGGDFHFAVNLRAFSTRSGWLYCRDFPWISISTGRRLPRKAPVDPACYNLFRIDVAVSAILPAGPTVTRPFERWMVPWSPSMYRSSLVLMSPFMTRSR